MQLTQFICREYQHESGRCARNENCGRCHVAGRCEFCAIRGNIETCKKCGVKDMKKARGILPTRRQKEMMSKAGLIPDNWLVIVETDVKLQVRNKRTGQNRSIPNYIKKDRRQTV